MKNNRVACYSPVQSYTRHQRIPLPFADEEDPNIPSSWSGHFCCHNFISSPIVMSIAMTIWERTKEKKKSLPSKHEVCLCRGYHVGCYPANSMLDKWHQMSLWFDNIILSMVNLLIISSITLRQIISRSEYIGAPLSSTHHVLSMLSQEWIVLSVSSEY